MKEEKRVQIMQVAKVCVYVCVCVCIYVYVCVCEWASPKAYA